MFNIVADGTLTADGTEQDILEITDVCQFSGFISLVNMILGDTVLLTEYVDFGTGWEQYHRDTFNGVQLSPAVYFIPKETALPHRITLWQTAGVNKTFRYKFIKEIISVNFSV